MRALIQRVTEASVRVDGAIVGAIDAGLLILLGVAAGDEEADALWLADRCARLRIFPDEHKPMNRSLIDVAGAALVVSQFTLTADTRRGRRPSFTSSAPPELAEPLVDRFVAALAELGVPVATGQFGADMQVALTNDGPVTFMLDSSG